MSTTTTNYDLVKPGYTDGVDIADINGNMDTIDSTLAQIESDIDDLEDGTGLPTMTTTVKGGAKLGTGLAVASDTLSVELLATSDGTGAGPISELTAEGVATQATTTGKNLFPQLSNRTTNGVTLKVNPDRSIVLNGTATDIAIFYTSISLTAGTTYTMSANNETVLGYESRMRFSDGHSELNNGIALLSSANASITFTATGTESTVEIRIGSGAVLSDYVLKPQLELGSTATAYEPYTGGIASPNPDYPQEIQVVRGRNLLDESTVENGRFINSDGSEVSNPYYYISQPIEVKGGETYYVSGVYEPNNANDAIRIAWYENDMTFISRAVVLNNIVTAPANAAYAKLVYGIAGISGSVAGILYPQFERGSVRHSYVPYGHIGVDVYDGSTHVDTIAVPLPSRGWVAGLPDGTADTLTLDGAGHAVWGLNVNRYTVTGSEQIHYELDLGTNYRIRLKEVLAGLDYDASLGDNSLAGLCSMLDARNGWESDTTGFYVDYRNGSFPCFVPNVSTAQDALAALVGAEFYFVRTPTTEDAGYVDMPTIPEGATITCAELDGLQVTYHVDGAATMVTRQYFDRAETEIGGAVVELAERVTDGESDIDTLESRMDTAEAELDAMDMTATGNGTVAGPILGLTADGVAEQVSTTGKNLLPPQAAQTLNGITVTVSADGSVMLDGTASANTRLTVFFDEDRSTIAQGTYTLSANNTGTNSNASTYLGLGYSSDGTSQYDFDSSKRVFFSSLNASKIITVDSDCNYWVIRINSGETFSGFTLSPQLELGSTATAYEPYTGGAPSPSPDYPQEIQVVRGRNLIQNTATSQTVNGVTFTVNSDGSVTANGTASGIATVAIRGPLGTTITFRAGTYTLSGCPSGGGYNTYRLDARTENGDQHIDIGSGITFTLDETTEMYFLFRIASGVSVNNLVFYPQLEKGSIATPYVPYGRYVGVDVWDGSTYLNTIHVPLPSRGWVGSLPDGTADTLTLDGAGHAVWTLATNVFDLGSAAWGYTYTNTSDVYRMSCTAIASSIVRAANASTLVSMLSNPYVAITAAQTWACDTGVSVDSTGTIIVYDTSYNTSTSMADFKSAMDGQLLYYPLATPTTEDSGYVDIPEIPEGAKLSIPELDGLEVRYFKDDSATLLAQQWYTRAYFELSNAITELAARVATLES